MVSQVMLAAAGNFVAAGVGIGYIVNKWYNCSADKASVGALLDRKFKKVSEAAVVDQLSSHVQKLGDIQSKITQTAPIKSLLPLKDQFLEIVEKTVVPKECGSFAAVIYDPSPSGRVETWVQTQIYEQCDLITTITRGSNTAAPSIVTEITSALNSANVVSVTPASAIEAFRARINPVVINLGDTLLLAAVETAVDTMNLTTRAKVVVKTIMVVATAKFFGIALTPYLIGKVATCAFMGLGKLYRVVNQ